EQKAIGEIEQPAGDVFASIHGDLIVEELAKIEKNILPEQMAEAKKLAQEYIQY
ncbi:MAG: hypothetical protein ACI9SC_003284, partial [Gammaproteobacteria bacterium]